MVWILLEILDDLWCQKLSDGKFKFLVFKKLQTNLINSIEENIKILQNLKLLSENVKRGKREFTTHESTQIVYKVKYFNAMNSEVFKLQSVVVSCI